MFAGSSTFAGWKNLEQTFEKYEATNRAIGGMVLSQVIWHSEALIFKNEPKTMVFYIGDNDALRYDYQTFERYMQCFVDNFFHRQPGSNLILVSVKPSPSREYKFDYYLKINSYLEQLATERKEVHFVDIWTPIATSGDEKSYFQSDMLHLNNYGNEVVVELLTPLLEEFTTK